MKSEKRSPSKRRYMMAVVLGTALSALSPSVAQAARQVSDTAVNDVSRYCTACWRNAHLPMDRWGDCTQEVLRRLLERVEPSRWNQLFSEHAAERREFVRAIDAVRKRIQRERGRTVQLPEVGLAARQTDTYKDERAAVMHASENLLTSRQNQILQMSMEGWSVQEMSVALALSPERISDEKYKAVRKLREHFTAETGH